MKDPDFMTVAELREALKQAVLLLSLAKCPDDACGGQGWTAHQVAEGVWEQEQCQWCYEKSELAQGE